MKDYYKLELDKYELGLVINALNEFRTSLINQDKENDNSDKIIFEGLSLTSPVDNLLLKIIEVSEKKPLRKIFER